MARYLDTGANDDTHSLGYWLDTNLIPGIREFHAQFAYFTYTALRPYADTLKTAALAGFPVHIVLGSNEKSMVAGDLRQVLQIVENAANASLTVVAYSNAKFHPKTVQIVRSDGSAAAVVGSGNFTHRGLGWNVEAGIALDTAEGDDVTVIMQVASVIDRWHTLTEPGIFPIHSETDIRALLSAGIISSAPPPRPVSAAPTASSPRTGQVLGSRQRLWTPQAVAPAAARRTAAAPRTALPAATSAQTATGAILPPQKWYKKMSATDSRRNAGHIKGYMTLVQAGFNIDHETFFRNDLFGLLAWNMEMRQGRPYDIAYADFTVQMLGMPLGTHRLKLHYAQHQQQSQSNYTTVLYWDEELKTELAANNCTNNWAVIERNAQGAFSLTIQPNQP